MTASAGLGARVARSAARRMRGLLHKLRRRAMILVYHRVAEVQVDPWDLAVRPDHFAEHLDVIRHYGSPMLLRDLVRSIQGGGIPRRAVVVTFDDGYADNLLQARPLLARFGVPATAFLTAGKLGAAGGFWWDQLTEIFLTPGRLPAALEIEIDGEPRRWDLGASAQYSVEEADRDRDWRGWHRRQPTARHRVFAELFEFLQPVGETTREQVMKNLRSWAGMDLARMDEARILSTGEAALLASDGLVEVGSHTMTHRRLSALNESDKAHEIRQSREVLQDIVDEEVTSFAYPFGQHADYDAESVSLVRGAGFRAACVNMPGSVTMGSELYELPRFYVSDWDGEEFRRQFSAWQRK